MTGGLDGEAHWRRRTACENGALIFETLFAAQVTGINRKNGSLRVSLSFATKRQFRSKMPFSQQLRSEFRSCEIDVTVLRSGTRVPKPLSQLRNTLRNGTFGAKSRFSTSQCISQLRNTLAETSTVLRNGLATKCSFRRSFLHSAKFRTALFFPCFCSVLAPISTRFFFFQSPWNFFHLGSFKTIKTHLKTWFKIKN